MPALLIGAHPCTRQMLPATLLGSLCPQRNHQSTPGLQPVSTLQRLTQSSPLSTRWASVLRQATLSLRFTGPQHVSRANTALTQLAHGCAAHCCSHTHTGELITRPQQPALQPGNHCASTFADTQSLHSGTNVPQAGLVNFNSTQYPYGPFQGPHIHKGVTTLTSDIYLP